MATRKNNASKTKTSVRTKKNGSPAKTKKSMSPIVNDPDAKTELAMDDHVQGKSIPALKHEWDAE